MKMEFDEDMQNWKEVLEFNIKQRYKEPFNERIERYTENIFNGIVIILFVIISPILLLINNLTNRRYC